MLAHPQRVILTGPIADLTAPLRGALSARDCVPVVGDENGFELHKDDIVIATFPSSEQVEHLTLQRYVRERSAMFLCILADADMAMIGPLLQSDRSGCIACARAWMRTPWSDQATSALHDGAVMLPWTGPFCSAAAEFIADAVTQKQCIGQERQRFPVWFLRSDFTEWALHYAMTHPGCTHCTLLPDDDAESAANWLSDSPRWSDGAWREPNPELTLQRLTNAFVDRRCGLIRSIEHDTPSYLHPMTFAPIRLDDHPTRVEVGVGRTGRRESDITVAILEALERFAGFRPRGRRTCVRGSYWQLRKDAVDPVDFILHDPSQANEPNYRFIQYSEKLAVNWIWAYSLRRGKPVLVPEQLAYYMLPADAQQADNRFVFEISNGCALGHSVEEAALYGLFELIERDAYLTSWYGNVPATAIDLATIDDDHVRGLLARLEGAGLEVRVCDIGVGMSVPAVGAFAIDRSSSATTVLTCAAGAHPDPVRAIDGALVEVCTMLTNRKQEDAKAMQDRGRHLLANPQDVATSADHIDQCRPPEMLERMEFMLGGDAWPLSDRWPGRRDRHARLNLTEELGHLAEEVMTVASDVLLVNQSFDGLRAAGLRCVKVLAPGLLPMTFGHQYRRVRRERIQQAIAITGRSSPRAMRWLPHTFP